MKAKIDQKTIEKFWAKVDKTDYCWVWTGAVSAQGYGLFRLPERNIVAHRASYLLAHGDIPAGLYVDHLCHNWDESCAATGNWCPHRRCVNPDHLEAVTPRVNQLRGHGITGNAARRTHCPQGHEYTPENTIVQEYAGGAHRRCRACRKAQYPGLDYAARTHCPQGHPYSEENTYRNPSGHRKCRTCRRAESQRRTAEARARTTRP